MKRFEGAKSREFDDYNQYGFCQYLAAPHGFQSGLGMKCQLYFLLAAHSCKMSILLHGEKWVHCDNNWHLN